MNSEEWGVCARLARSASHRALAAAREARGPGKFDPLAFDVLIYTDDPTAAAYFTDSSDLADICGVSGIEGVAIIKGDTFPPASVEANREMDGPRVSAMLFKAAGHRCPRCWKHVSAAKDQLCGRCERVTAMLDTPAPRDEGGV